LSSPSRRREYPNLRGLTAAGWNRQIESTLFGDPRAGARDAVQHIAFTLNDIDEPFPFPHQTSREMRDGDSR